MSFIYLLQALCFIYVAFLAGKLARDYFGLASEDSHIKKTVYAIGIGYGIIGNAGLLLALAGLYKPLFFYALALGSALLSRETIEAHYRSLKGGLHNKRIWHTVKNWYASHTLVKIIITLWVTLYTAISFLPSALNPSDALFYHIPFAMETVQTASISFPVKNQYSYGHLPLFTEIFYGVPMTLFHNFVSFKIIQLSAYFLLLILIIDFLKKYVRNELFVWIGFMLLLANMPLAKSALEGGIIDIFTTFFGLVAILALIELAVAREKIKNTQKILLASGIFLGLALSTKYIGLFFAIICFALILFHCLRNKEKLRTIIRTLALYTLPVIMLCGFWYIKNIIYVGNPFFPFFSAHGRGFMDAVNDFVLDRTLPNFFIFPFFFFGKEGMFTLPYAMLTAVSFVAMYAMVVFLFIKKRITTLEILIFACIELYLFLLFFFSHIVRFAIPALILTAVLTVLTLDATMTRTNGRFVSILAGILAVLLFAASIGSTTLQKNIACLSGMKSPDMCLQETTGAAIHVTNYINSHLENETVLEYWNIFYFFHLKYGNSYSRFSCLEEDDEMIQVCLKARDINYLVDDTKASRAYSSLPEFDHMKNKVRMVDYFIKHGTLMYDLFDEKRNTHIRLYRLNR